MKLSTRSRYGTRALIDIAMNSGGGTVLLRDVAARQEISTLYLEHLITPLIAAGIIRSTRGAKGGIWLGRAPEDIRLSDVVLLLEGSVAPVACVDDPNYCHRRSFCVMHEVWGELKNAMSGVLESYTIADLVERQKEKRADQLGALTYQI